MRGRRHDRTRSVRKASTKPLTKGHRPDKTFLTDPAPKMRQRRRSLGSTAQLAAITRHQELRLPAEGVVTITIRRPEVFWTAAARSKPSGGLEGDRAEAETARAPRPGVTARPIQCRSIRPLFLRPDGVLSERFAMRSAILEAY